MDLSFYHRANDPWSHLLLQVLPRLLAIYDVSLRCITVPLAPQEHFPRPDLVALHALKDAQDLAKHCELEFIGNGQTPSDELTALVSRSLLTAEHNVFEYLELARHLGDALFAGDVPRLQAMCESVLPQSEANAILAAHQQCQLESGHYNSGMIAFGDKWYWGVDRISHLENDLLAAGRRRPNASVGLLQRRPRADVPHGTLGADVALPLEIDFFCSFRSPYAYLASERTFELQRRYPVRIRPRLILPMKMAGFTIPPIKATYFRFDPAREALRLGMRFGNFCDPFGVGLERAMSLVEPAREAGRLEPYLLSVMQGVWADGIDTASDAGLRELSERAGLDWSEMQPHLMDEGWRSWATVNRLELERLGQYAAPTYRLGNWVTWGQDRIWMIEREIEARLDRLSEWRADRRTV